MVTSRNAREGVVGSHRKEGSAVLPEQESHKPRIVLNQEAQEERRKRYKHIQYRNLILKSALSFVLGMLFCYFLKHL